MTIAAIDAQTRGILENRLPDWVSPVWCANPGTVAEDAAEAEIAWLDLTAFGPLIEPVIARAPNLRWVNTVAAGIEVFPTALMAERGIALVNGAGINAKPIAEFVVMGMLEMAKNFRDILVAQERAEWLPDAPGKEQLAGARVLIVGAGHIGSRIATLLRALEAEVVTVRRTQGAGHLGPGQWQPRLAEFDWVVIAAASTDETRHMIGAAELAAMKPSARIVNLARGALIDQDALVEALQAKEIGGAFLDVTTPEPLPSDSPLWSMDNVRVTMHLSGRAQESMFGAAAERFLANLDAWKAREPLAYEVPLARGY